jgi:hypothetical protein
MMKKYSEYVILNEASKSAESLPNIYSELISKAILEYFLYLRSAFKELGISVSISNAHRHIGAEKNEAYIENNAWLESDDDEGYPIEKLNDLKNVDKRRIFLRCEYSDYVFYIGFLNIEGTKFRIFTYRTEMYPEKDGYYAGKIGRKTILLHREKFWKKTEFDEISKFREAFVKAVKEGWIEHEKEIEKGMRGGILAKKSGIV